jgi:uncharacterized membrane protein YhaH (DUF805 family)
MPTQNNNPATIKFWETEQRRLSEKMLSIVEFWLAITVLVALNNPSVKVVVKRYFDMFLIFVVLFVFIIAVGLSVNLKVFCVHSILMINLLIFIAEPNAVRNISWGWIQQV